MIEIENILLENWLKPLKPYQRNTIRTVSPEIWRRKGC